MEESVENKNICKVQIADYVFYTRGGPLELEKGTQKIISPCVIKLALASVY